MNFFSSIWYLVLIISTLQLSSGLRYSYSRNSYQNIDVTEKERFLGLSKVQKDKSFKRYSYNRVSSSPCRSKDENGRFFWSVNVYNIHAGDGKPCGSYGDSISGGSIQSDYYRPQRRPGFFSNFLSLFIPGGTLNPTGGVPPVGYPPGQSSVISDQYRPSIATTTIRPSAILSDEIGITSTTTLSSVSNNNYNRPTNRPVVVASDQYYRPQQNYYQPQQNYYRPQQNYYRPQQNYYRPEQNYYRPQQINRPSSSSNPSYQPPRRPSNSNNYSPSSISNSGYYRPEITTSTTTTTTERPQLPSYPSSSSSNNFGSSSSSNSGQSSSSNINLINADRPIVENFDDEPPPVYSPFSPGQLVGGLIQSVNGVVQTFTGETYIPGRGFFARLFS